MLPESKLFNFIDSKNGFAVSFLEGQRLIHDLAMIHDVKGQSFAFFRDATLTAMQLVNYLKPKESMGFFIDSDIPYFRLKYEIHYTGQMRTLLLPEELNEFPKIFNGKVRVSKMFPHSPQPYTSILEVKGKSLKDVVNDLLRDSYQLNSEVVLSEHSDQSYMISKLPEINVDKEQVVESISLKDYHAKIKRNLEFLFNEGTSDESNIIKKVSDTGFDFLAVKEVKFKCNCSRGRMVTGVLNLAHSSSVDDIFQSDKSIETKCDYCKTTYLITKDEIEEGLKLT